MARALIEAGADPTARTIFGATPLHSAAARNATSAIAAIVGTAQGREAIDVHDVGEGFKGRTAFDVACAQGFLGAAAAIDGERECDKTMLMRLSMREVPSCAIGSHGTPRAGALRACGAFHPDAVAPTFVAQAPGCAIDARRPSETTPSEFIREYVAIGKPVLIKGGAPALGEFFSEGKWGRRRLREKFGHVDVHVGDIPCAPPRRGHASAT